MTRIIGGQAGGRRLATPKGDGTRPTSDRVREALFSSVQARCGSLVGLRVLDLYAGSGALGLEAWSRGAESVTLVESHRRTAALIEANANLIGCSVARVIALPVRAFLSGDRPTDGPPYDIVLMDPPYPLASAEVDVDLSQLATGGWLADEALVIVERGVRSTPPQWPAGFAQERSTKYGETVLHRAVWTARGEEGF